MTALTYAADDANLTETLEKVAQDREPVIIRTQNASVVAMPLEDYESWAETIYLQRSPANAARLAEAMQAIANGQGIRKNLTDLADA